MATTDCFSERGGRFETEAAIDTGRLVEAEFDRCRAGEKGRARPAVHLPLVARYRPPI